MIPAALACVGLACLACLACGSRRPPTAAASPAFVPRVLPAGRALVLATSGPRPADTSVTFPGGERRVIVLRHGPPENVVFAELRFTPASFAEARGRAVRVDVRPRAGVYGVDVATTAAIGRGATVVFKYPRYFAAPPGARQAYATDARLERALAVGRLQAGGAVTLLPSTRPASDNLAAPLVSAGSYLVVAPR